MELPLSTAQVDRLEILDACGSTNTELVTRASAGSPADWPDISVLVTDNQTGGRGRLGRVWVAPAGQALACSVLLRPTLDVALFGWLPLIAGAAMTRAVASVVPSHRVSLKWPNDVQIDGRKVSGLLAELLPGGAVVMGAGVNLTIPAEGLPTPTSTSLLLNDPVGPPEGLADAVLSAYLRELRALYRDFLRSAGDPVASGVSAALDELCSTLGEQVRVELPGGDDLRGRAVGIDGSGRLQVRSSPDDVITAVAAGDVTHLRYE